MTHKLPRWETLLADAIVARSRQDFAYGSTDCAKSAAGMLSCYTDLDFSDEFPEIYDEDQAMKFLKENGGLLVVVNRAMKKRGIYETSVNAANRGDVVMLDLPGGRNSIGIMGPRGAIVPGITGLVAVPRRRVTHAWRIV